MLSLMCGDFSLENLVFRLKRTQRVLNSSILLLGHVKKTITKTCSFLLSCYPNHNKNKCTKRITFVGTQRCALNSIFIFWPISLKYYGRYRVTCINIPYMISLNQKMGTFDTHFGGIFVFENVVVLLKCCVQF